VLSPLQKAVLFFAAVVLLFVVLCPATPTPTAVVKKQVTVMLLLVAAAVSLWKFALPTFQTLERGFIVARETGPSILDLNCTRLC
jgi:hypothetical protein